jgi:hypothetical protein
MAGAAAARAGDRGWFLADEQPARALGPALAWAGQHGITDLHLLAEEAAGVLARRAALFDPAPTVWQVDGRDRTTAAPEPPPDADAVPAPATEEFALLLADVGVDVVVEHGVVSGEVLGLEVARVVVADDGSASLEVGVGRHDREAFAMVHGDLPAREALATVVDAVRAQRTADRSHPLSRLAQERWLRAELLADPARVGCARLEPVAPVLPRRSVKDVAAAGAVGEDADGRPVVVACSVGIDLDLVPSAADLRAQRSPGARLLLAVPERDDHPVTRRLAGALVDPAEVLVLPADWRSGVLP